ncbi:alpha/beta fold hydrolase [Aurantiacibacter rhizosphaerae]|uniref:Alpha/beta fold hydrolase n=1 Tax=Aurantiacibacter rhizosphaerae TaxID=2691582 RepID=A0A844X9N7_9SPHN|nr:alpha/beta hydrolase [Aurantiacibacter rhizosphaerae]MWV26499.1 alpha/beta fold hydrolase [Aurantiacibacter rhizosphaerae]
MMTTQFHETGGQRIAYRHNAGSGPAVIFLPGYMSDMAGGKATAVFDRCVEQGRECLLLDYSGCGESDGDFADGSLSQWRDEVLSLIDAKVTSDKVLIIGSSMGGWLMLLVGMALGERLHALIGIASAPDFSDWGFTDTQKESLRAGTTIYRENNYGYDPTPTHALFWKDAEANRLLDGAIGIDAPVRLIHGQDDTDVPPETSLRLARALTSTDVQVTLIKGGDHRLSREGDIALLLQTMEIL